MKKYYVIVICFFVSFVCFYLWKNNDISPTVKLFKEHLNKCISLNGYNEVIGDTIFDYTEFRRKYPFLMINYIDEECSVCKFKLKEWYKYANSLPKREQIAYLFIYRGTDINKYLKSVLGDKELYPFYYLCSEEFTYIMNNPHIDRQIIDSGYLINNENQILVIGSPISSLGVKELITKAIE